MSKSRFPVRSKFVDLQSGAVVSPDQFQNLMNIRRQEFAMAGVSSGERIMLNAWTGIDFFVSLFAVQDLAAIPFIVDPYQTVQERKRLKSEIGPHWAFDRTLEKHSSETRPDLPRDTAMVLFTSGTSAKPKAVIHRYENLNHRFESCRAAIPVQDRRKPLCALPLHFAHGLLGIALPAIQDADTLFLAPRIDFELAAKIGSWVDQHEIDFISGTPAFWNLIVRFSPTPKSRSLRRVQVASALSTKKTFVEIDRWAKAPLFNCYGLTETASWISDASIDIESNEFPVGDGSRWGTTLKVDAGGQIQISTKSLFAGYWGEWSSKSEKVELYDSGDLGRLREDGQLVLSGRLKRQINRGGLKVSPEEVELAILETGLVTDAVVCEAPPSADGNVSSIAALVVFKDVKDFDDLIYQLEKSLSATLSPSKIPSNWHHVDRIPRRSNGKPDLIEIGLLLSSKSNS